MLHSSVLRCVFPGYAAFMAVTQVATSGVALAFTGLSLRQQKRQETQVKPWSAIPTPSASVIREKEGGQIELEFIFSEFERKLNRLVGCVEFSLLPCLLVHSFGHLDCLCRTHGIQILTGFSLTFHHYDGRVYELFREVLNMFNFSPVTTTGFFWSADAKLIAGFSFAAIVLLPAVKLLIWGLFPFRPQPGAISIKDVVLRPYIGQIPTANLYTLTFVAVAMSFNRQIAVPFRAGSEGSRALAEAFSSNMTELPTTPSSAAADYHIPHLLLHIKTGMNPGFGSFMFEITFVISLLLCRLATRTHVNGMRNPKRSRRP